MNIGKLDRYVTIQSVSYADDDYGDGQTPTWSNYATNVPCDIIWANVRNTEKFEAAQLVSVDAPSIRLRYDSGIVVEMRVVYNSENYYITGITEIGRGHGMNLATEKRDNE